MTRNKHILALTFLLMILTTGIIFLLNNKPEVTGSYRPSLIKCPESYASEQDTANATALFYGQYMRSHKNANIVEMARARLDFLKQNNCTETLKSIEAKGGVEQYVADLVTKSIIKSFKCPNEYPTFEEFYAKTREDEQIYMSAYEGSTIEDFRAFYDYNYKNHNCLNDSKNLK